METWSNSIPNLDDMYRLKSTQEIETVLNNWLNGGVAEETTTFSTTRGAAPSDALDELVAEVKSAAPSKKTKKVDDNESTKKQSLDDAFADLMGDE